MTHKKYQSKLVYNGKSVITQDLLDLVCVLHPKFRCAFRHNISKIFLVKLLIYILPQNPVSSKIFKPNELINLVNCLRDWYFLNYQSCG